MASRIIGITGGIGTGKSTVSNILKKLGAYIIDTDIIARRVVRKGEKALAEIVSNYGSEVLKEDGELDREFLAKKVFNNEEKLEILNEITHKYIIKEIFMQINEARNEKNKNLIIIEAPLPIKHGFIDTVDEVWVVASDKETRVQRIIERSGLLHNEILSRIDSQDRKYDYLSLTDKIIINDGTLKELEEKVEKLLAVK